MAVMVVMTVVGSDDAFSVLFSVGKLSFSFYCSFSMKGEWEAQYSYCHSEQWDLGMPWLWHSMTEPNHSASCPVHVWPHEVKYLGKAFPCPIILMMMTGGGSGTFPGMNNFSFPALAFSDSLADWTFQCVCRQHVWWFMRGCGRRLYGNRSSFPINEWGWKRERVSRQLLALQTDSFLCLGAVCVQW